MIVHTYTFAFTKYEISKYIVRVIYKDWNSIIYVYCYRANSIYIITVLMRYRLENEQPGTHTVLETTTKARALISRDLCIVNDCFMRYWTPFTWKMYLGKRPHTKAFVFDTRKYCSLAERDSASIVIDDCCFSSGLLVTWRWHFEGDGDKVRLQIRACWGQFLEIFNWEITGII